MSFDRISLHRRIYLLGLLLIAAGLPLSPFLMSAGQGILLLNWLVEGRFNIKFHQLLKNKAVLAIGGIILIHLLGLLYTNNYTYALKDIRIKLPIFLLLLIIPSSERLSTKELIYILGSFISAVFISSIVSIYIYMNNSYGSENIREISPLISHIRLSLMVCLAIFACVYVYLQYKNRIALVFLGALSVWFLIFIGLLGSRAGYLSFFICIIAIGIFWAWRQKKWWLAIIVAASISIASVMAYYFTPIIHKRVDEVVNEVNLYYQGQKNASGYSIMQRLFYWNIAVELIKEHPLIGVGTGDIDDAYKAYYKSHETGLDSSFQHRGHNQYITITITFGIIGLALFLYGIFAPAFYEKKYTDLLYGVFFLILVLSMITEDTLETQAGATFYAFFNMLFLFAQSKNQHLNVHND